MDKDNLVDFPQNIGQDFIPPEPTHYIYEILVRNTDGGTTIITQQGYLIATGAFVGVCQGPYNRSEFVFVAPMEQILYANRLGAANPAGQLRCPDQAVQGLGWI